MRRPCEIEGCEKPHSARGLCNMHYYRLRKHGDPFKGSRWLNVERDPADYPPPTPQPTPCQIWSGSLDDKGYGRRLGAGHRHSFAHRMAWEQVYGPIPLGLFVMHLCDNPPCINPDHLRLGTHAENMADMVAKGRSMRGEKNRTARLTEADVRLIRISDESTAALARRYGVSWHAIGGIRSGETWRFVA